MRLNKLLGGFKINKIYEKLKDMYMFRRTIYIAKYGSTFINLFMLTSIILIFIYLWTKVDKIDELIVKDVFGILATVFGALLSLLGVFVIPRYDAYNKDINDALMGTKSSDIIIRKLSNRHYRSFVNERTEYIKKFLFVMFLIMCVFIGSIFVLLTSRFIINTEFGILIIFSSILFSIITIFIMFLFIISCFPTRIETFKNDGMPIARWFQFWKWVEWIQFSIYI